MAQPRLPTGVKVATVVLLAIVLMAAFVIGFCFSQRGRDQSSRAAALVSGGPTTLR